MDDQRKDVGSTSATGNAGGGWMLRESAWPGPDYSTPKAMVADNDLDYRTMSLFDLIATDMRASFTTTVGLRHRLDAPVPSRVLWQLCGRAEAVCYGCALIISAAFLSALLSS